MPHASEPRTPSLSTDRLRGFLEAAGSFSIVIKRAPGGLGYQAVADFTVKLPAHEEAVLRQLQRRIAGRLSVQQREAVLKVTRLGDVQRIARLLASARLLSEARQQELAVWRQCIALIANGSHRTREGLLRIALLRDQMHSRRQWNKRNFCVVRKAVDPCHIVQQEGDVKPGCRICYDAVDVPLARLGGK